VAMRRAAERGDGWMPYLYSADRYARSVATIREHADRRGRDLSTFQWCAYIFVSMDDDPSRARARAVEFLGGTYQSDFDAMLDRVACVGTVEQVTERLAAFVAAGAQHLVLAPCGNKMESARQLLAEVLPRL
jgi:alkanesulfonate monooxygenase SsuD/methylene tetrahydromethanopterin reductase-like flavin-dependent oxidoreductase (luciferase family)